MANLVLTNLDTGQQTVITDSLTLDEALASVKIVCNAYTDNSTSNVLVEAKEYADKAMLSAIANILPTIPSPAAPLVDYPKNSGAVRLVVGTNTDGTLKFFDVRNQEYIQAGDLLALQNSKAFTLLELADAKLKITDEIKKAAANSSTNSKTFTQKEIARVEGLLQALEAKGFTFETFMQYLDQIDDNLYVSHLNSTIEIDGKIQRFHYKNEIEAEFELHNISKITRQIPTSSRISFKDEKHNGFIWKYVANDNIDYSYFGLFAIRNNVVDNDPYLYIDYKTGGMRFINDISCETINLKNAMYDKDGYSSVVTGWDMVMYISDMLTNGDLVSKETAETYANSLALPIGSTFLMPYPPQGYRGDLANWLFCNGTQYDIAAYPYLNPLLTISGFQSGYLPNLTSLNPNMRWMIKAK